MAVKTMSIGIEKTLAPSAGNARGKTPPGVEAPNYNRAIKLRTVDFDDANRPKSCLEIDFPIGPVNTLAQLELNARKPIYEMGKWWARRQSSIFRAMLIAAATEVPEDPNAADRAVWEAYYANHQRAKNFAGIRVLDPFMGGGTTLIEGSRLGFDVVGIDLNPVAWFVTKSELSGTTPEAVAAFFAEVERQVRPHVQPYAVTECPRGHRGRWFMADDPGCPFGVGTAMEMGYRLTPQPDTFDILSVAEDRRPHYRYAGPEVIYTFWVKHGPCLRCGHRTPVMRSPVVATKDLSVRVLHAKCPHCPLDFDWELDDARMAPAAPLVVASDESPFVVAAESRMTVPCPACGGEVPRPITKPAKKKVLLSLLIHPMWLAGSPGADAVGELGGWAGASVAAEQRWLDARAKGLSLIEVRGALPAHIVDPLDGSSPIDTSRGTAQRVVRKGRDGEPTEEKAVDSSFVCGNCGFGQDFLTAVKPTEHTAPAFAHVLQGYCPDCDRERRPYNGRFFKVPDSRDQEMWLAAVAAWEAASTGSLGRFVPTEPLPFAHMTHERTPVGPWGYTHWWKMFNPRQLLTHARLVEAITVADGQYGQATREAALLAFQQYLRNQNMFCFWNPARDTPEPFFSNNNYHPKAVVIENSCFAELGRGNWSSCTGAVLGGLTWARAPWEKAKAPSSVSAKGVQLPIDDPVDTERVQEILCRSSTDLTPFADKSFDLVITDPPFGGNVFYADLADFFYAWLRRPLATWYPEIFATPETNKIQEAIENPAEHPDTRSPEEKRRAKKERLETPAEEFYRETLTACWAEAARVLKDGGTLAFTFHHSEDQAWIAVLRSLFDAGFVLVATYPIRSDESKGDDSSFGSKKIEYDIIHVCRKRLEPPARMSWAGMRRWVKEELVRLHDLLEHYRQQELPEADIRVILRGKALEYYSRHYGQIFTGLDEPLDVAQALIGINEILEEDQLPSVDRPPDAAEPLTGLYLRIFTTRQELPRDEFSKLLRGTGAAPQQFHELDWTVEENKVVRIVSIQERFQSLRRRPRNEMRMDLDQAHFLIGAAVPGTGIVIREELERGTFVLKPGVRDLLRWYAEREPDNTLRTAAELAANLVERFVADPMSVRPEAQLTLFADGEAKSKR